MKHSERQNRIDDFERRAAYSPANVTKHSQNPEWRYLEIHPFSDDTETLERLSLLPSNCFIVDAWCFFNGDAALLESSVAGVNPIRDAGLFARRSEGDLRWTNLKLVTNAESISRVLFENAMTKFAELGFPDQLPPIPTDGSAIQLCGEIDS